MIVRTHGVGGAQDLPIPLEWALAGGAAALAVSFIVLGFAWRSPRYDPPRPGRPVPALDALVSSRPFRLAARAVGLVVFGYTAWAAIWGPDLATNPTFGVFYVLLWVGIVPASLLFGPFYRAINPARTLNDVLAKLVGADPDRGLRELPSWVGYWPAALGLFAFVWQELVNPQVGYLPSVRMWVAVYLAVLLIGGAVYGGRWIERADPFEVYSTLVGHLSVWGRDEAGRLVVRSPLANLATMQIVPGLTAVVAVLLGSTAFDSFKDSPTWLQFTQSRVDAAVFSATTLNFLCLVVFCLVVWVTFSIATAATGVEDGVRRHSLPNLFAPAVMPIVVGYMVAHYLNYFVVNSTQTLRYLSDPMVRGDDYLGLADLSQNFWLTYNPAVLATIKVAAVVLGHVVGIVASHDRAVAVLPPRHQLSGQLPLLIVMVAYTLTGLTLLFGS